jgi:hypothetical protein
MRKIFLGLILLSSICGRASAFPPWMQSEKAGRFMFNFKFGAAVGLRDVTTDAPGVPSYRGDDYFAMVLDFGVALDDGKNAYLIFPIQFQVHDTGASVCPFPGQPCVYSGHEPWQTIMLPVGFQYDIAIKAVPGLYITPRAIIGYAAYVPDVGNTVHAGFVAPELGVKLVIKKRLNVGFEPFSLPIFFAPKFPLSGNTFVTVQWRLLWYAGVNF